MVPPAQIKEFFMRSVRFLTSLSLAMLCLGLTVQAEDELAADIADYKAVPVRKIERRSGRRHSA